MSIDRDELRRQYADGRHLDTRASLYRDQRERVDLVAEAMARLPAVDGRRTTDDRSSTSGAVEASTSRPVVPRAGP